MRGNMKLSFVKGVVVLGAMLFSPAAFAADCNFDKPVGSCSGSITVTKIYGSKPSYGAEIVVSSSAPQCSKVEYYVDSTPYQTVFKNSSSEGESLHGTKPFSKGDISVEKCTVYEGGEGGAAAGEKTKVCIPRGLVQQNLAQAQAYVKDNKWKIDQAEKNRRDEQNDGDPDAAYIREMTDFIAQWGPVVADAENAVGRANACLANASCACP